MNDAANVSAGSAWDQPIVEWVWREKYRHGGERTRDESFIRVANAVYDKDREGDHKERALRAMRELRWCPAGRIHAGAGTGNRVTLINCFVAPTLQDSMNTEGTAAEDGGPDLGIMDNLKVAALTQQMGGGIGTDFSPLRPNGALVRRTGSVASGPLPFMDMWDAMCDTVMSAGARRGAMMATLRCDHPDIEAFITAKRIPGRLTNFNLSVLVTDAFMEAIKNDAMWELVHEQPPANADALVALVERGTGAEHRYVYKDIKARALWDLILRNTYEHAEPGVIFIDRVNHLNNLRHLETIAATNPCGEQPLPPNGDCNLGAVNLAAHVAGEAFTAAAVDWEKLEDTVRVGVRFLDNVLDVTQFPTDAQRLEAEQKRRIGLGVTGLASLLQLLRVRYGSPQAVELTERIMRFIANVAYDESTELARARGTFPLCDECLDRAPFLLKLDKDVRYKIQEYGLRNGVLLTVAPTGTTSVYYDNVSSGIEPTYSWKYTRKTLEKDGSRREHKVYDWGYLRYCRITGRPLDVAHMEYPDYMVTAEQLTVEEHLQMQAAAQRWVDASISKTINCPVDMTYEEFRGVYDRAFELGLKGVTTYRPNPAGGRGAVLEVSAAAEPTQLGKIETTSGGAGGGSGGPTPGEVLKKQQAEVMRRVVPPSGQALRIQAEVEARAAKRVRPDKLPGVTYKIRSPHRDHAYYVTICDDERGQPFEIFVATKDANAHEWLQALTRMVSAVFRKGGDVDFVAQELREVRSMEGWFEREHFVPGLVARIGEVIEEHIKSRNVKTFTTTGEYTKPASLVATREVIVGRACPRCGAPALTKRDGCDLCTSCGYTKCD